MAGRFSIEAVFKANDQMSRMIAKIEGNTKKFSANLSKDFEGLGGRFSKVGSQLGDLAQKAGVAAIALAGAGALALSHIGHTGMEFEQMITDVGAVMGKSRSQIGDLEKEAMRLGVVTKFSATQVAEAMEFMARKGFDSQEILQGIPGVLNAVAASGQGMAEVATVVGSTIRGFGLDAGEASRVANILAYTAEKTGASITDMGSALAIAAPTAKTLGVSIEDTAAAVGLLQKMGIDASTAGTATATMLAKITKPSKEAAQEMTALGIKFDDAKGNMLPFNEVLGQFVKAGDKAGGNMRRMAFFAELVGLRGDKAAIGLSDMAKSGDFAKLVDGIKNTGDYAAKVAALRMETTTGSWKLLTSTVEVLETKLFNLKGGALKGVIDSMNGWLGSRQDQIVQNVSDAIEAATPVVKDLASAFVEGFNAIMPAVRSFAEFMFKDFGSGAEWMTVLKRGAQILGGLAVAAIGAAVVFGGVLAVAFADVVTAADWLVGAWNSAIAGLGATVFFFVDWSHDIAAKWRWLVGEASAVAQAVIDGLVNGFKNGAQWVIDAATNLGTAALDGIKKALHIHSPSRAFADVGEMSALGVAQGLTDGAAAAVNASEALAGKIVGALAIKAPAPDMSALARIGSKGRDSGVPAYAVGYDQWPPRAAWLDSGAERDEDASHGLQSGQPHNGPAPQVLGATDMVLRETIDRHFSETKSSGEYVIRDETGRGKETKPMKGVRVVRSGGM
jgi:TP901 family phage tail tape measure protein